MRFIKIIFNLPKIIFYKLRFRKRIKGILNLNSIAKISISCKNKGKIILSRNITYRNNLSLRASHDGLLTIGNNCFFNFNNSVTCLESVKIGNNCMFGNNVVIVDHDHDYKKGNGYITDGIIIEDNVWIGANCVILRGTYIGNGSVVAAGSVVKGYFKPHSLIKNNNLVTGEEE